MMRRSQGKEQGTPGCDIWRDIIETSVPKEKSTTCIDVGRAAFVYRPEKNATMPVFIPIDPFVGAGFIGITVPKNSIL
jgi:hypothetical protein